MSWNLFFRKRFLTALNSKRLFTPSVFLRDVFLVQLLPHRKPVFLGNRALKFESVPILRNLRTLTGDQMRELSLGQIFAVPTV